MENRKMEKETATKRMAKVKNKNTTNCEKTGMYRKYPKRNESLFSMLHLQCSSYRQQKSRIEKCRLQLSHQSANKPTPLTTHHTTHCARTKSVKPNAKFTNFVLNETTNKSPATRIEEQKQETVKETNSKRKTNGKHTDEIKQGHKRKKPK